ncbi:MAG: hypothetical protein V1724_00245 [Chloroflexota bacterium]
MVGNGVAVGGGGDVGVGEDVRGEGVGPKVGVGVVRTAHPMRRVSKEKASPLATTAADSPAGSLAVLRVALPGTLTLLYRRWECAMMVQAACAGVNKTARPDTVGAGLCVRKKAIACSPARCS